MCRLRGFLLVAALLCLGQTVLAEAVAQVLGVPLNSRLVNLYDISDTGEWSSAKAFLSVKSNEPIVRRAQQVGDVVYVLVSAAGTGLNDEYGKVIRFRLDGSRVDEDCYFRFDGHADGMAVTPDGKYVFASISEGTYQGRIYRYSVDMGKLDVDFVYLANKFVRQICCDGDGFLYAAERTGGNVYKFAVSHASGEYTADNYEAKTASGMDLAGACCYHPVERCIYQGGRTSIRKLRALDLSEVVGPVATPAAFDWFYASGYVNGIIYFPSFQTSCIYEVSDACVAKSVTEIKLQGICEYKIANTDSTWPMDEPAGSAVGYCDRQPYVLYPQGGAAFGASPGALHSCVLLTNANARVQIAESQTLIPKTGDFAVFFWVRLPARSGSVSTPRQLFSNARGSTGEIEILADANNIANSLGFRFTPAGESASLTIYPNPTKVVANDKWHNVGLVRQENAFYLWFDGEKVGSVTAASTKEIAQQMPWCLGCGGDEITGYVGAQAAFDELKFVCPVMKDSELRKFYTSVSAPTTAPVAPALKTPAAPPAELEVTQIAHSTLNDAPLGMPAMLVDSTGVYWATADRANGPYAWDRLATVYRSDDRGVTWKAHSSIQASNVALFETGGRLCAIGMEVTGSYDGARKTVAVWREESGTFAKRASISAPDLRPDERLVTMASSPVIKNGRLWQPVARLGNDDTNTPAFVSFAVNGSTFSGASFTSESYRNTFQADNYHRFSTMAGVLGGCAVGDGPATGSGVTFYWPIVDAHRSDGLPLGLERAFVHTATSSSAFGRKRMTAFRGGAKPFAIRYDAVSELYWAVTVPVTNMAQMVAQDPAEAVGTLALYASPDLAAWYPCGEVLRSETHGFVASNFAFDGDDLVIALALSAPDGIGARARTDANYLVFKRVPNFRTRHVPYVPTRERLYVSDLESNYVYSYYRTPDGEWQPGSIFVDAEGNGKGLASDGKTYTCVTPGNIRARHDRIFVLSRESAPARVFEFSPDGALRRIYVCPWDDASELRPSGMDVSADGSYALLSHMADSALTPRIVKLTFAENKWETIVTAGDGHLSKPADVVLAPDGSFYCSNYMDIPVERRVVNHYSATGAYMGDITDGGSNRKTGVAIADDGSVYCGELSGSVYKYDAQTSAQTVFFSRTNYNWMNLSMLVVRDKLFSVGRYGIVSAWDLASGTESAPLAFPITGSGIGYSMGAFAQGLKWLMR